MEKVVHEVEWAPQGAIDCLQSAAAIVLAFLGYPLTVSEIKHSVPVFVTKDGREIGSSVPHLAAFTQSLGLPTTIHSTDIELLDRSWSNLSARELQAKLEARGKRIEHGYIKADILEAYLDGYNQFIAAGGVIKLPILTTSYIHQYLVQAPLLALVSTNYLYGCPKQVFSQESRQWLDDDVAGRTVTHALVVAGYDQGKFLLVDTNKPDKASGRYWVESDHLIGAICLAETEWDNSIITIARR